MIRLIATRCCPSNPGLVRQINPLLYGVYKPNTNAPRAVLLGTRHELAPTFSYANADQFFSPESETQKHFAKADRLVLEVHDLFEVYKGQRAYDYALARHPIDLLFALQAQMEGKTIFGFNSHAELREEAQKAEMAWKAKNGALLKPQEPQENQTTGISNILRTVTQKAKRAWEAKIGTLLRGPESQDNQANDMRKIMEGFLGIQLAEAFLRGDEQKLDQLSVQGLQIVGSCPEIALYQRNKRMAQVLNRFWKENEEGLDFVAVGAAHLVGTRGLCSELRDYEWTIKRLV